MDVITIKNQDYVVIKNFNGMYFEEDYIPLDEYLLNEDFEIDFEMDEDIQKVLDDYLF
ncbi:MAG: hypothetical protein J6S67_04275 [Methanobrevibacter sp.]|nr:hypothetical protein [Methanobrevibacter sp.]